MIKLRILIIRPGAFGDTVLTAPVLAALRAKYPAAWIELAGRPDYGTVLVDGRLADACVSFESPVFASLFTDSSPRRHNGHRECRDSESANGPHGSCFKTADRTGCGRQECPPHRVMRRPCELSEFDIAVAYLPDADGRVAARLGERCGTVVVFDPRPKAGGRVHITGHLLRALAPLGISDADECPRVGCREEWHRAARGLLGEEAGGGYVVMHSGSGGRRKLWQAEKWAEVIAAVSPRRVVLTCGPADEGVVADILSRVGDAANVAVVRGQPVTTLAGVLAGASVYVGCDSGVTHLAAALGVPTVAVFGPSDLRVWGPRGPCVRVLAGAGGSTGAVGPAAVLGALAGGG